MKGKNNLFNQLQPGSRLIFWLKPKSMFKSPDSGGTRSKQEEIDSVKAPKKSLESIGEQRAAAIAEKAKKTWGGIKKGFFRLLASPEAIGRGTVKATGAVVEKVEGVSDKLVAGLEGGMDMAGRGAKAVGRAGMEVGSKAVKGAEFLSDKMVEGIEATGRGAEAVGRAGLEAGAFVASKAVEGAVAIKDKAGEVMDRAREKYNDLSERGAQAYENFSGKVSATKGKFFEYINNKKMERLKAKEDKKRAEKQREITALMSMQDQIRRRIAELSGGQSSEATA